MHRKSRDWFIGSVLTVLIGIAGALPALAGGDTPSTEWRGAQRAAAAATEGHGLWPPFVPAEDGRAGGATTWKVVFDRLTARDRDGADAAWGRWGPQILAEARGLPRMANQGGSRNIAPNAAGTAYLYLGTDELAGWLERDYRAQLGPDEDGRAWGLQGQEQLSTVYLGGVVAVVEAVYEAARGRHPALADAARDLLRAHALSLALFAVDGAGGGVMVVAPGARSPESRDPDDLEYWLERVVDGRALVPAAKPDRFRARDDLQGVAVRAFWAGDHSWASAADRQTLRRLIYDDQGVEAVVAELQRLGARFVAETVAERYRGGDVAAWMVGNPHQVTAPTLAASRIGDRRWRLSVHPRPWDSGGPRSLGRCSVDVQAEAIRGECRGAVGFREPPPAGVQFDRATSTYSSEVPRPPGEPLWSVTIDRRGVWLTAVDAKPSPSPPAEPPGPRPPSSAETTTAHLEAVAALVTGCLPRPGWTGTSLDLATRHAARAVALAGGGEELVSVSSPMAPTPARLAASSTPRLFDAPLELAGLEAVAAECGALSPARIAPECVTAAGATVACGSSGAVRLWPPRVRPGPRPLSDASACRGGIPTPAAWRGCPRMRSVDVAGDHLWIAYGAGLMTYDLSGPSPRRTGVADGFARSGDPADSVWMYFTRVSEQNMFLDDIAAALVAAGRSVAFVAGKPPVGPSIWTLGPEGLVQLYQDAGGSATDVEVVENGGRLYGVAIGQDGIALYDVTAAAALTAPCLDDRGAKCPGVYLGRVPGHRVGRTVKGDAIVHDAVLYIAHGTSGVGAPAIEAVRMPPRVTAGTVASTRAWAGADAGVDVDSPTWLTIGPRVYLALAKGTEVRVHDAAPCLDADGCAALPPATWTSPAPNSWSVGQYLLTTSTADGRSYLYLGVDGAQRAEGRGLDALWDVTGLAAGEVVDLFAGGGTFVDPCNESTVNAGGWLNMGNANGANEYHPRVCVVADGGGLYCAAESLLLEGRVVAAPPGGPEDDPPPLPGLIFRDGFEGGDLAAWR